MAWQTRRISPPPPLPPRAGGPQRFSGSASSCRRVRFSQHLYIQFSEGRAWRTGMQAQVMIADLTPKQAYTPSLLQQRS